jgi:hypothetical protein
VEFLGEIAASDLLDPRQMALREAVDEEDFGPIPSGVFTETALNFCSCAWPDVAREMRNAATDIPARWFQGDA